MMKQRSPLRLLVCSLPLALLVPQAASAETLREGVACIDSQVLASLHPAIVDLMVQGVEAPEDEWTAATDVMNAAGGTCAKRFGWSPPKLILADGAFEAEIMLPALRGKTAANYDALDAVVDRLPAEFVLRMADGKQTAADLSGFQAALRPVTDRLSAEQLVEVGGYVKAKLMLRMAVLRFASLR